MRDCQSVSASIWRAGHQLRRSGGGPGNTAMLCIDPQRRAPADACDRLCKSCARTSSCNIAMWQSAADVRTARQCHAHHHQEHGTLHCRAMTSCMPTMQFTMGSLAPRSRACDEPLQHCEGPTMPRPSGWAAPVAMMACLWTSLNWKPGTAAWDAEPGLIETRGRHLRFDPRIRVHAAVVVQAAHPRVLHHAHEVPPAHVVVPCSTHVTRLVSAFHAERKHTAQLTLC